MQQLGLARLPMQAKLLVAFGVVIALFLGGMVYAIGQNRLVATDYQDLLTRSVPLGLAS
jgi:hypothetical protein